MQLLASGRDADVFALDATRVLRRCRDPRSRCEREAELMEWVRQHGYPVPRVHRVDGPELVLDRIAGPTLVEQLQSGTTSLAEAGALLADLHTRLHAIATPAGSTPGSSVLHLDLHPLNILMSDDGPVVIDWANADIGAAGFDVALTGLILAQVASLDDPLADAARGLLDAFLTAAGSLRSEDVDAAVAYRTANPTMSSLEIAVLPAAATLLQP